jgi:hypothetical protein
MENVRAGVGVELEDVRRFAEAHKRMVGELVVVDRIDLCAETARRWAYTRLTQYEFEFEHTG